MESQLEYSDTEEKSNFFSLTSAVWDFNTPLHGCYQQLPCPLFWFSGARKCIIDVCYDTPAARFIWLWYEKKRCDVCGKSTGRKKHITAINWILFRANCLFISENCIHIAYIAIVHFSVSTNSFEINWLLTFTDHWHIGPAKGSERQQVVGGSARFNDTRGKVTIGEKVSPARTAMNPLRQSRWVNPSFLQPGERRG